MPGKLQDFDLICKIVVIGDSAVGKTNLVFRYAHSGFDSATKATIGVAFASNFHRVGTKVVKAHVWDTAGQEKYKAITSAFYRGTLAAMLVYDITQTKTFENVDRWLNDLQSIAGDKVVVTLVGNKSDLCQSSRAVPFEKAKEYADQHGFFFIETSALLNTNVQFAFDYTVERAIQSLTTVDPTNNNSEVIVTLQPTSKLSATVSCCRN